MVKVKTKTDLLFRKAFIPWYDTEPVMMLTLGIATGVLLFSMYGVAAAMDIPRYLAYLWVPCLLGAFALIIIGSTLIRMSRRVTSAGSD